MTMLKSLKIYIIFILFSSCLANPENCLQIGQATYDFNLSATLSPALDTFDIGDTITIISEFSDKMIETHTGQERELVDFNFYPKTYLEKIDEEISNQGALDFFELIIDSIYYDNLITFGDGQKILLEQYHYERGIYKLEYKLIPRQSGLYFHRLGSDLLDSGPHQPFEDKCSKTPSHANVILNNGEDNNVDFLLDSPDPIMQKYWDRRNSGDATFSTLGGYCFYVR